MHAHKRMEALLEQQRRAGILPATVGDTDGTEALALARSPGRLEARPTLNRCSARREGLGQKSE